MWSTPTKSWRLFFFLRKQKYVQYCCFRLKCKSLNKNQTCAICACMYKINLLRKSKNIANLVRHDSFTFYKYIYSEKKTFTHYRLIKTSTWCSKHQLIANLFRPYFNFSFASHIFNCLFLPDNSPHNKMACVKCIPSYYRVFFLDPSKFNISWVDIVTTQFCGKILCVFVLQSSSYLLPDNETI